MSLVVVMEDDPVNALLFRNVLERRGGLRVVVTEDVDELLRLVCSGEAALVLMDVSLAHSTYQGRGVNGVELTQLLKEDPVTAGVPVLLATAHAMRGDEETLLRESGADGYVAKPVVDQAAFVVQVQGLIEKRRAA
jgi:CheY-like chemotaxis protein